MLEGAYRNKKTAFFFLVFLDFVMAAQFVLFSVSLKGPEFGQSWLVKSYLISFVLALLIFGLLSNMFKNPKESEEMIKQGLVFFIVGSLICFFFIRLDFFILGRILMGLAAGMILLGQIGIIWFSHFKNFRDFSFWMTASFFLGFFIGPFVFKAFSWSDLNQIKISLILGIAAAVLAILGASRIWTRDKNPISILEGKKKKVAIWGIGYLGNAIIVYGFDYFLYPFVIWKFGILEGGVVMTFLSFLICYATIIFYDWAKKDWLGIETIKEVKEYNGKSMIGRFTSWILRKSDPVVLLFLSIKFDPFITTAYMRKGAEKYNGLGKRDWIIFLSSLIVGNVYWTFVAFTGVSVVEYVWRLIA